MKVSCCFVVSECTIVEIALVLACRRHIFQVCLWPQEWVTLEKLLNSSMLSRFSRVRLCATP